MTDSGSFDAGDIMYATDLNALAALANAKCAEAGVAQQAWYAPPGGTVTATATDINYIISRYQAAWDASSNKPGTRQSTVSSGGTIYGALFQNMWTQLNQMTFSEVPIDTNTFYCPMSSSTTNAGETGSGGGLSGSDLALACGYGANGGINAISSGSRAVWGNGYLSTTLGFTASMLTSRTVWTWMCKFSDWVNTGGSYLFQFYDGSQWLNIQRQSGDGNVGVRVAHAGVNEFANFASPPSSSGNVYMAIVRNGTLLKAGWATSMFTSWSSAASTLQWTLNSTTFGSVTSSRWILGAGDSGATTPNFKAAWVAMSKTALVS